MLFACGNIWNSRVVFYNKTTCLLSTDVSIETYQLLLLFSVISPWSTISQKQSSSLSSSFIQKKYKVAWNFANMCTGCFFMFTVVRKVRTKKSDRRKSKYYLTHVDGSMCTVKIIPLRMFIAHWGPFISVMRTFYTSIMESFCENGFQLLSIFTKTIRHRCWTMF